ncbi:MAG TPA: hypothetical protein VLT84_03690, partial [Acidobacteriota bacterium]|nr:hypothetical protein [Acidobacteriota bacterium]
MHDALEQVARQVVGKIKVGQVVAHGLDALLPQVLVLFHVGIAQPLAVLRVDGLGARLLLELGRADHAAPVQLL